jgi:phosphoesterase RecJ-like protein
MSTPLHPLASFVDAASGRPAPDVLEEIATGIRRGRRCLLFAHANPDGDALGSQAALALALRSLGVEARAICALEYPETFRTLFPQGLIEVLGDARGLDPGDVRVLLDTGETARAGPFADFLRAPGGPRYCVDHHPWREKGHPGRDVESEPDPFDARLIVPASPSTGNLVLALLDCLGAGLTEEIAAALWIAIATDTGWFRFANTSAWAMRDAARLLERGVPTERIYQRVYAELSPERARVLGTLLAGIRTDLDGRLVW